MRKAVITKDLVVKRLREGYYSFSALNVNKVFRADLKKINFDLSGANLSEADLSGANLSEANLSGANLWEANLSEADLSGANLSGANLWKADLSEANLWKANLRNAEFNCVFCKTKVFKAQRKYIMEETDLFEVVD